MKGLLSRRATRRSIGLLIDEREVTLCVVARTPLGPVEEVRRSGPRGPGPLEEVLGRALAPWLGRKLRPKVVLGVPELKVFHTARLALSAQRTLTPPAWLQEVLLAPGTRVEEMAIDVAGAMVGKRTVMGLVSCRRKSLNGPLEALARLGARLARAEPTPCALLRLAGAKLKAPRGSKLVARFFLGEGQALGVLAAGGLTLHWRSFDLPAGEEATALLAALAAFRMHARRWQAGVAVDAALIHGRPDLGPSLDPADLAGRMGLRVARADGPGLDPGSMALGLALGGLAEEPGYDLARSLKPRESIREIFPRAESALQVAALLAVILLMAARSRSLESAHASTRAALARYRWVEGRQEADLAGEKKDLELKGRLVGAFLAGRVAWSTHLRDVASRLPANTRATSVLGVGELEPLVGRGQGTAARRSFVLQLETAVPPTGEAPREVDALLRSLREQSWLRRDFPVIELKDLKAQRSQGREAVAIASYGIVCLPPPGKAGSPRRN